VLDIIIKGIIGAKTGGNKPTERATTLGINPINIAAELPNKEVAKNKVAFTMVPVIGWK